MSIYRNIAAGLVLLCGWISVCSGSTDSGTASVNGDFPLTNFRSVRRGVMPEQSVSRGQWAIRLDREFYRTIDNLNNDLRITDGQGRQLPFLLERCSRMAELTKFEQLDGKIIRTPVLPDGRHAVDFELEKGPADIGAIELVTSEERFAKKLSIAVGDGQRWEYALSEWRFADLKKLGIAARRIQLEKICRGRIIRLIFGSAHDTDSEKPLKIEVLRVYQAKKYQLPDAAELEVCELQETERREVGDLTQIIYRSDRSPLAQIKVEADNAAYQRRITLSGSNTQREWTVLSGGNIRKVDLDNVATVDVPESRYKYYKLEIYNDREAPLEGVKVTALSAVYKWSVPMNSAACEVTVFYDCANVPKLQFSWQPETSGGGAAFYEMGDAKLNFLRKTGVADSRIRRYMAGAAVLALALVMMIYLAISLRKYTAVLPGD